MIPQAIVDQISSIPISQVLSKYMTLIKKGVNYQGCCPFHDEKTPSFSVSTSKNIFKCFGCNAKGNAVSFVMDFRKISFPEAIKEIGHAHGIQVPEKELTEKEKILMDHKESLFVANSFAGAYFQATLLKPENKEALDYALGRWTKETITKFQIGFAPDSRDEFLNLAKASGFKTEILMKASLISERTNDPGQYFNFFRNRLIIPLHQTHQHIVGFIGRSLHGEDPKYFNSRGTDLYTKGSYLFGLNLAAAAIKQHDSAYLVEGNADVIRMHQLGYTQTVGSCGTALARDQILMLKKLCNSITIIPDNDVAGKTACDKSAQMILSEGMNCNVIQLPDSEEKLDADSFFTDARHFQKYANESVQDYIITKAKRWSKLPSAPENTRRAIEEITDLIFKMDPGSHDLYIDQVSRLIKPKKAWQDKIKELFVQGTHEVDREDKTDRIPEHVSLVDWQKYGFYADKNCYFFRTQRGIERGCNFILVPLFHIESTQNAKRIFRITNEYGITRVIEIAQRDLISLGSFKVCVESLGNFLWEVSDTELNKLKRYLYQETKSCLEITQLGWHKDGFYSWGNGIFNGSFIPVDEYGIASHRMVNYYLPAFSTIWERELQHYLSERQFAHRDGNPITLNDYSQRLIQVFGNNASVALCFYFASLFRDIIIRKFNFFPILDLFGPKGAGKTELAVSIMSFFGKMGKGPNINNTSKAALADHVSQLCNACAHIDEYKNSIDLDKIEFLKGLWDGTGRTRMNMDKDKKKETTAVDCAVILSGQEMPTADIALFSRLIYLTFSKYEYNDQEKKQFNELKAVEKLGNTHITNQLLSLRQVFLENYHASYEKVAKDLTEKMGDTVIEDRIFRNWLLILATYHAIKDRISVAFTYEGLVTLSASQILIQNSETKKSNEISTFWSIVEYLAADGLIHDGIDFKVEKLQSIKTDEMKTSRLFPALTEVIYIQMSRIFQLYRKHGKQSNEKILPLDSIIYYLKNDKRFLGITRKRFRFLDTTFGPAGIWKSKPEHAYCFLYDELGVSLDENSTEDCPDPSDEQPEKLPSPKETDNKLPF